MFWWNLKKFIDVSPTQAATIWPPKSLQQPQTKQSLNVRLKNIDVHESNNDKVKLFKKNLKSMLVELEKIFLSLLLRVLC